ncbi:VCBS repeat-containing protein [Streptomyces sp. P9(2023)]|uniref:FG-GAP repeat domain-containing protein n=1 Tax=Streptomyces sp. P9(2023) TaxID=3064394 RepID=UPI0028F4309B|nr:VCBS repeat-containing protein [Streptomyces sp. P9(2023)]MDT9693467.1 VCBS repeat-containing protein [Streptomyces sp. P9(2023)]
MPRSALLRHSIAAVTAATLLAGIGPLAAPATAAPAGAAAAAASLDPWSASVPLTDGTAIHGLVDVKTAKDGAVVALWYRTPADYSTLEYVVAVRAAGSTTWGAPHVLVKTPSARGGAQLTVSADGSVTAGWTEFPNDTSPEDEKPGAAFRMSVLPAGATTWSAPVDVATSPGVLHGGKIVGSPSGTLVAMWTQVEDGKAELRSSVRTAPGQAWSEPVRLDEPAAGAGLSSEPEIVYTAEGTATVSFVTAGPTSSVIQVVDRTADGVWSKPATVSAPGQYAHNPKLALGRGGHAVLLWATSGSPEGQTQTEVISRRGPGSLTWGAQEPANGFDGGTWRKMAVGPEGDVTLLGAAYIDGTGYSARTTTRSAATGTWSAIKTISTGYVPDDQFDLTTGPDGSVHAVWTQGDTNRKLMTSSRVDGAWSAAPTPLSTNPTGYALGLVTVDGANRPVAVWQQSTGRFITQLRAATTAPAPAKPLPAWRDFSGDGKGDLLGLTSAGALTVRTGSGTGGLGTGASATGWPATSTVVPFGDLSGDRCDDVLVRSAAGVLTRHDGGCGTAFAPNAPKLTIGSGWQVYDALTAPGDLTGDGRTDLLARTPAGELWMYADDGAGKFKGRVKIGAGWQTFDTIVGVGDLNGDKAGDLLARDTAGVLWRYNGTGKGTFATRVKIGPGWQTYNTLAAVGDITGDGKADLVGRDTTGALYRYNGTGAGTFAGRVKIGGGWQMYKTLS